MQKIKIACTSGITLSLDKLNIYPGKLKKHSEIEIERICDSILNDGFLFPIAVGKINDKNYIIDGECTYYALQELKYRGYEIDEVPIFYVKSSEKTIKRNILIATSTNHCVLKSGLEKFSDDERLLKKLAFNEGSIIDFYSARDFTDLEFEKPKREVKDKNDDYFSLLNQGVI